MAPACRRLCVQDATTSTNPLGVPGAENVPKPLTVAVFDSALQQVADHLDACVGVRCVADAAPAEVTIDDSD